MKSCVTINKQLGMNEQYYILIDLNIAQCEEDM